MSTRFEKLLFRHDSRSGFDHLFEFDDMSLEMRLYGMMIQVWAAWLHCASECNHMQVGPTRADKRDLNRWEQRSKLTPYVEIAMEKAIDENSAQHSPNNTW